MTVPILHLRAMSLSARRAWIEIYSGTYHPHFHVVALRKESVDRNFPVMNIIFCIIVALRKESVDRNFHHSLNLPSSPMSLSARRAWIEIIVGVLATLVTAGRSPQGERG